MFPLFFLCNSNILTNLFEGFTQKCWQFHGGGYGDNKSNMFITQIIHNL